MCSSFQKFVDFVAGSFISPENHIDHRNQLKGQHSLLNEFRFKLYISLPCQWLKFFLIAFCIAAPILPPKRQEWICIMWKIEVHTCISRPADVSWDRIFNLLFLSIDLYMDILLGFAGFDRDSLVAGYCLKSITIYPIKSCGGFSMRSWPLTNNGNH